MNRHKLVSIIIPAYNSEKWIDSCIKCAKSQTWPNKEIIVIDDGSIDRTYQIAKSYENKDIKVETQPNMGASAARNAGLKIAQGDYIQWIDSDDLLDPDKITQQMNYAEFDHTSTVLFSGAWGRFFFFFLQTKFIPDLLWDDVEPHEWLLRKIENNLWMPPMVFLVSRTLTEKAGLWNEKLKRDNDGEYFCRVISNASTVKFIARSRCFKRRARGISYGGNLNDEKLDSIAFSLKSSPSKTSITLYPLADRTSARVLTVDIFSSTTNIFFLELP